MVKSKSINTQTVNQTKTTLV